MYLGRKALEIYIEGGGYRKALVSDTELDFIIAPRSMDLRRSQYPAAYYAAELFAEYANRGTAPVNNYYRYLQDIGNVAYPLHEEYHQAICNRVGIDVYSKYCECIDRQEKILNVSTLLY